MESESVTPGGRQAPWGLHTGREGEGRGGSESGWSCAERPRVGGGGGPPGVCHSFSHGRDSQIPVFRKSTARRDRVRVTRSPRQAHSPSAAGGCGVHPARRCAGATKGAHAHRDGDGRWGRRGGPPGAGFPRTRPGLALLAAPAQAVAGAADCRRSESAGSSLVRAAQVRGGVWARGMPAQQAGEAGPDHQRRWAWSQCTGMSVGPRDGLATDCPPGPTVQRCRVR